MDKKQDIESLITENKSLKNELENIKLNRSNKNKIQLWFLKRLGNLILGSGLKNSITNLIDKYNSKKTIDKDNIADVATHIIWRITRVGIFALIIGVLPSVLLFQQNSILTKQNKKFDTQNEKIQDQSFLIEAQRRSNLQFEISEILNRMGDELKVDSLQRKISASLKSRIIAATVSMKPYKSLAKNGIIENNPYSYERGQLFTALVNAQIHKTDLQSILDQSNFSNMFLENIQLKLDSTAYFKKYIFTNSYFKNVSFENIVFADMVEFVNCKIDGLTSTNSFIDMVIDNSNVNRFNFICHKNTDYLRLTNSSISNSNIINRFSPRSHSFFENITEPKALKEQVLTFDIDDKCLINNLYFQSISASFMIREGDAFLDIKSILFNEYGKLYLYDVTNPNLLNQIDMDNIMFYTQWERMEEKFGMKKENIPSNNIVKKFPKNDFLISNIVGGYEYTNYVKEDKE